MKQAVCNIKATVTWGPQWQVLNAFSQHGCHSPRVITGACITSSNDWDCNMGLPREAPRKMLQARGALQEVTPEPDLPPHRPPGPSRTLKRAAQQLLPPRPSTAPQTGGLGGRDRPAPRTRTESGAPEPWDERWQRGQPLGPCTETDRDGL